jgi:polysaccharide pyruvyl transferase WcaK-like protein
MKIGILTQPLGHNYGGLLQNYALQVVLKRMGHEPVTISPVKAPLHRRAVGISKNLFFRCILRTKRRKQSIRRQKRNAGVTVTKNMRDFIAENIAMTDPALTAWNISKVKSLGFDAYVVGSDQIWRPRYSPYLPVFFLNFVSKNHQVRKVAYAASFGVDDWELTASQTRMAKALAPQFDRISVREDSAVTFCKDYLDTIAVHVLDPTMLLSQVDYETLIDTHPTTPSEGDLFAYVLDRNTENQAIINKVSTELGLKPFELMPGDSTNSTYPSVYQWLRSFRDAKFVITDSFHGTVFSILFNKPFISIANETRGKARFSSILNAFKLNQRLIHNVKEINSDIYEQPDPARTADILNQWQKKSLDFLTSALSGK